MACPGKVDYHVHYYMDGCANPEMTLPNIDREARAMGLEEIAVLKHYSSALPNGKQDWVSWHVVKEEDYRRYLQEMADYHPAEGLRIFSGVETELVNGKGDINIAPSVHEEVDVIALSVHYMPAMEKVSQPFLYHPRAQKELLETDAQARQDLHRWTECVRDLGSRYFVEELVRGYVNAFARFPRIRQTSHMYDGLFPLRDYLIPYEEIPEKELIEMMEPLMEAMVKHEVLWELLPEPVGNERILHRAAEKGVQFVASADGHSMHGSWGRFTDHPLAEALIDQFRLPKGVVHW